MSTARSRRSRPTSDRREIIATGIRFPVGLTFNAAGDLFATDQEGATWLPNGNPFDELLHIQPGRHYGFPPRHPKHLPAVIDEPSASTTPLSINRRAGWSSTSRSTADLSSGRTHGGAMPW